MNGREDFFGCYIINGRKEAKLIHAIVKLLYIKQVGDEINRKISNNYNYTRGKML